MEISLLKASERLSTMRELGDRFLELQADAKSKIYDQDVMTMSKGALNFAELLLKDLQSSEQQHFDLTAALPQMLWATRPDGFHIYFNKRWVEYTGRSLEDSYGFGWIEAFHPEDRARTLKRWQQATESGEAYEIEYRLRRADGSYGWVLGRALPLHDSLGTISKWFGSCTDIDSQKKAEELAAKHAQALALANDQLTKAESLKNEFFSNVSHELRTPLTLLLAPLESLLSGDYGEVAANQKPLLDVIHNNAIRLFQMVNGLLDFSKLEAKKFEPNYEPIDIVALTRSIFVDFQPLILESGLNSEFFPAANEIWVNVDRYLWERIAFNLLSNAVKFTPKGGRIAVSLGYLKGEIFLQVKDTGIGIDRQNIPLLFEKFKQIESAATRRFEGTGLGLSLVKEFSQLLGGDVKVESKLGEGSIFSVFCRLEPVEALNLPQDSFRRYLSRLVPMISPEIELPLPEAESHLSSRKVLVVEDNADLGRYILAQLKSICQTRLAHDGDQALEMMSDWKPDLVLSDVMMPNRDGISLCREIKGNSASSDIPVILLTALTHREALLQGWEAGADEYLFKPFHPRELRARVKTILDLSIERQRSQVALRIANLELEEKVAERTAMLRDANAVLRRSESAERAARLEAERLAHVKDEFLITLSHELRTPLVPIIGWIGLINSSALDAKGVAEALKTIERSARYELQLIEDLLDTSRIISGKMVIDFSIVNLLEPIQAALETVRLSAEAKNITLNVKIPVSSFGVVRGEKRRLQQVVWNLLGNAIKFTPKGGRIDIEVSYSHDFSILKITDTGVGIKSEFLPHVFERFRQADSSTTRNFGGLGLGLALARQIVEAHGGTIRVESAGEGCGSTFILSLPISLTTSISSSGPLSGEHLCLNQTMNEAGALFGLKILVVDDSPEDRKFLKILLSSHGANVAVAENVNDGLEKAISFEPDLVLSDIGMPDKDGYELIREIRFLENKLCRVPAIALTAYGSAADRVRAIAAGFQAHITKPADSNQLVQIISELTS